MPYQKLSELPDSVRDNLPKHAQENIRPLSTAPGSSMMNPKNAGKMPRARKRRTGSPGLPLRRNMRRKETHGCGKINIYRHKQTSFGGALRREAGKLAG